MLPEPSALTVRIRVPFKSAAGPSESSTCGGSTVARVQPGKKSSKSRGEQRPPPTRPRRPGYSRQLGFPQLPSPHVGNFAPERQVSLQVDSHQTGARHLLGTQQAPPQASWEATSRVVLNCALRHCPQVQTGVME